MQISQAFTPAAPVNDRSLFADRPEQLTSCFDAVWQRGLHVALYGERGVGKTSLANILPKVFRSSDLPTMDAVRIDCNSNDSFKTIWRKVFRGLSRDTDFIDKEDGGIDPDEVRLHLQELTKTTLIVIDELDRVEDDEALSLLADTVKTLSDHSVNVTLMFVGVAASVEALLGEHESIIRNIRQVHMPRMSRIELTEILESGFNRVDDLTAEKRAIDRIVFESEGLPHFTHLLGLNAGQVTVKDDRHVVLEMDVERGEIDALQGHSLLGEYRRATSSHQPDHLFEEVVIACAYAPRDHLGCFRAGDLREPLSAICGRDMGIRQFQRHLNELSGQNRRTLSKEGEPRHYVYRFRNPLFEPYAKIAAQSRNLITPEVRSTLQSIQAVQSAAIDESIERPIGL